MSMLSLGVELAERGLTPDWALRAAIRRLCGQRVRQSDRQSESERALTQDAMIAAMKAEAVALLPETANAQHYEVPAEFFAAVLGRRKKYSCCFWDDSASTLDEAEVRALEISCDRAELVNGQDVLELGCGWGSISLWIAERYPASRITAVSNSHSQRRWIEAAAVQSGLKNLRVVTADMNDFSPEAARFDRVVSVEMFEHMRNYEELLRRIAGWLRPSGKLFVHIFCHRRIAYPYEVDGAANWMGRYFFTGGIMPSANLLPQFSRDLTVASQWSWNGRHYQRTAEAWLENLDARRQDVLPILAATYGRQEAHRWFHRWRMFFLAVAEFFGLRDGEEWFVAHYLLQPTGTVQT